MGKPLSPAPVGGRGEHELPAYVSNGLIGLRVRSQPLASGMALVCGFAGEHPERRIEAAARAPYPLHGDLCLNGVWLSDTPHEVADLVQAYDFATGELTSRFVFRVADRAARCEVMTFASREDPTLVCQEVAVRVDGACDLAIRAGLDAAGLAGRALRHSHDTPGEPEPACDASLLWESAGGLGQVGCAYITEWLGPAAAGAPEPSPLRDQKLLTAQRWRARSRGVYRLRQITSLIPDAVHRQPDHQATRLVAKARFDGFETLRRENRRAWDQLWKGRIRLVGAEARWQALADAAFFYLNASVHPSSPASTSIFGLATWHDYHYYYGHVMWDIEAFACPVLSLVQPHAAEALLDYRSRSLPGARGNARLFGRRGVQFPWESAPASGEEASPLPGRAAWHEDHVSLDVAKAFAFHADLTGDRSFLREKAWPVLSGVAEWLTTRVWRGGDDYEIRASMGIAEREQPVDNAAYTNMAAVVVLEAALAAAETLSLPADSMWGEIARRMALPRRGRAVVSHDKFRFDEEKGATPDPLMGLWPMGFRLPEADADATIRAYLAHAPDYIGSPMLSALYGVWAARVGERAVSLRLLEEGYAQFEHGRFSQILEYRADRFPEQPMAAPFFANMGGFLASLVLGFPGLEPDGAAPDTWARRNVVLPEGWDAIVVDRVFVRGRPMRLEARHGERCVLTPLDEGPGMPAVD